MSTPTTTFPPSDSGDPQHSDGDVNRLDRLAADASADRGVTMRAVVFDDYGPPDVLHVTRRPIPSPLPGQVLIRVSASSVNPIDYRLRKGEMKRLLPGGFPRVPGYDVAGTIADCASDAPFSIGTRVMAFLDRLRGGAAADYVVCAIDSVAAIPASMPFDEAAAIPLAGCTALQSLRDHGRMKPGQHVLVNGASGGVGMFAVQIAVAAGCHVDAVASGDNEAFCKSLGATHFYDYGSTDFTKSDERWDLVFDAAGKADFLNVRHVLKEGGRYVSTEPDIKGMAMTLLTWPFSKSGKVMLARSSGDDLRELIRMYENGQLKVTIDGRYPLSETAAAHNRVQSGVDRGKVVILN